MSFTSFEFVAFFAAVMLGRSLMRSFTAEKWFMLVAGCAYYMSWSIPCVVLLLLMSLTDYSVARKMELSTNAAVRKRLLVVSLLVNLGLLGFFKYSNFFLENLSSVLNGIGWHVGPLRLDTILPPAISYFAFAGLSYVLDVYYERIPACKSARDYALFITFFPKLISGPIVRAREFLPQLKERVRAKSEDVEIGLACFLVGAVKKLVVADQISSHVNVIFAAPTQYDRLTLLQGLMGYAVQIYCDFSGYSDMAIGCARILGYRLPENFQMPFSATSITEFWRRWHITLSTWFRDYAFLPLEIATRANPYPVIRVSLNIFAMMLLVGLWHGPSWNFVIFGGIHGMALVTHKIWTARKPFAKSQIPATLQFVGRFFSVALTLAVVLLGFVFFRTDSMVMAGSYLHGMFSPSHHGVRLLSPYILATLAAVVAVHFVVGKDRNPIAAISQSGMPIRIVGYACLLILLACFGATDAAPFIYVQF